MRKLFVIALCLLTVLAGICLAMAYVTYYDPGKPIAVGKCTPAPEGAGWVNLLDEANGPLWKNIANEKQIFEVKDEVLHIFGGGIGPLQYATYTGEPFGDFDLHLEFKLSEPKGYASWMKIFLSAQLRCNSGVFLRVPEGDSPLRGFEVQVLDDYGWPANKNGTGSIYDVDSPMFNMARPTGEWNSYDISLRGSKITVTVNGWKVIDTDFAQMTAPIGKFTTAYADLPASGRIALQDHGGEVWYRNIRIKPAGGGAPAPDVPSKTPALPESPLEQPEDLPARS